MFCPECGTLAFPGPSGNIKCPNYECGYHGTSENKVLMEDGTEIDISKASSSSKVEARELAETANVPLMPASGPLPNNKKRIMSLAREIGYPVMIKATWGGGGRGMRVVNDEKQLIENMVYHRGLGLSANQIGIPVTVFAMMVDTDPLVVFNPEIIERSEETTYMREGCLSFPGLYIPIKRSYGIATQFQMSNGEEHAGSFIELSARVFQHEMDHMKGNTFLPKVSKFALQSARRKQRILLRKEKRNGRTN